MRECDEESQGKFVAYVDMGDDSYDVMLETDAQGQVKAYSCDCKPNNKLCVHLVALILFINNKQKTTKKTAQSKQKAPHSDLLASLPYETLQVWVSKILGSNKEVLFEFMQEFERKSAHLTQEQVKTNMAEAVRAIIGKAKKIDANQAKKIVELWKKQHLTLLEFLRRNPTDHDAAKLVAVVIQESHVTCNTLTIAGQKIQQYPSQLVSAGLETLHALDDKQFEEALENFVRNWMLAYNGYILYSKEFRELLGRLSISKKIILNKCVQKQLKIVKSPFFNYSDFIELAIEAAIEAGTLKEDILHYEPIAYKIDYNLKLLGHLINCEHFERAENIAIKQITFNKYEQFDLPYWTLLIKIYTLSNQYDKKIDAISKSLHNTFNKEDYLWLMDQLDSEEEKNKLRTKLKSKALSSVRNENPKGLEFLFWLYFYEGKSSEMLNLLKIEDSMKHVVEYLEFLYKTEGLKFLYALAISPCSYSQIHTQRITNEKILEFITTNYSPFQFKLLLKSIGIDHFYMNYNPVFLLIKSI